MTGLVQNMSQMSSGGDPSAMCRVEPAAPPAASSPEQLAACLKTLRTVRGNATVFFNTIAKVKKNITIYYASIISLLSF